MKRLSGLLLIFLLACTMPLFTGCDSNNDEPGGTEPDPNIAFTPDTYNAPDNSVYLEFVTVSGADLIFDVKVKKVTGVYGVAFALHFDQEVFEYLNSTEGSFLNGSGAQSTYIAIAGTGVVTVGISLLGSETSPVSGSGTLCSIVFRNVANGRSRFDYRENRLLDADGQPIPDVQWFGGLGIAAD